MIYRKIFQNSTLTLSNIWIEISALWKNIIFLWPLSLDYSFYWRVRCTDHKDVFYPVSSVTIKSVSLAINTNAFIITEKIENWDKFKYGLAVKASFA